MAAPGGDPSRDAAAILGLGAGGEPLVRGANLGDLRAPLVRMRERLDARFAQPLQLLAPLGEEVWTLSARRSRHSRSGEPIAGLAQAASILVIFSLRFGPRGTSTLTTSPRLWPTSALPIGDSLESLSSVGSASAEPTIWNFFESPDFWSLTWTRTPTETTSVLIVLLVDHGGAAHALLELGDPLLEQRLLVLGVVVLGVLHDVAELASVLDPLGDLAALHGGHVLQLLVELLQTLLGDQ